MFNENLSISGNLDIADLMVLVVYRTFENGSASDEYPYSQMLPPLSLLEL